MPPSTPTAVPKQGASIWVQWDVSEPPASPVFSWFEALVHNIQNVNSQGTAVLAKGIIEYYGTDSFESCTYTVRFLRNSLLSHSVSPPGSDSTPCPWRDENPDDDEYLPDADDDSAPEQNHGSSTAVVDVQETLLEHSRSILDHARSIQGMKTRLAQLQTARTPMVPTVDAGWFHDFAFYSLVVELNKPLGNLGRRLHLPGTSAPAGREKPFYGLLRTVVSVSIPCPFPVFSDIAKSHYTWAESKSYIYPEFYPSYNSYLLPCNLKNRYVIGFSSFFAVCAALSQLDPTVTSTFLVRQHPTSLTTRVLGTLPRNPSDPNVPLHIHPGYSWDGVLPSHPLGSSEPAYLKRVTTLDLRSTEGNPDTSEFRHKFKLGSRDVANTTAGDVTREVFKYNTFTMEWLPPTLLPRGLAHLPVKNKSDLGVLQINLPAVGIAPRHLRAEVDALLTPAVVNNIASSSIQ